MAKAEKIKIVDPVSKKEVSEILIECPGCKMNHTMNVDVSNSRWHGVVWQFNEDLERPTFSPSLRVKIGDSHTCHSFIRAGKIEFLSDCTHAMRGMTVDLPELS